jgi:hypothetical protein
MNLWPMVRSSGSIGRKADRVKRNPAAAKSQKAQSLTRAGVMHLPRVQERQAQARWLRDRINPGPEETTTRGNGEQAAGHDD